LVLLAGEDNVERVHGNDEEDGGHDGGH
jgi:hypothetical protein